MSYATHKVELLEEQHCSDRMSRWKLAFHTTKENRLTNLVVHAEVFTLRVNQTWFGVCPVWLKRFHVPTIMQGVTEEQAFDRCIDAMGDALRNDRIPFLTTLDEEEDGTIMIKYKD